MNENMDKMELNLDDLDVVAGGGLLECYYNVLAAHGGVSLAKELLPQGKKVTVTFICNFMTEHAPDWARYNKDFSQKVYGML